MNFNCFLINYKKSRWGFTPIDEANRFGHDEVVKILQPNDPIPSSST